YKAVVVFQWLGESPGAPRSTALAGGGGVDAPTGEPDGAAEAKVVLPPSLTREWVEDRILDGLEEYEVFSDFTLATLENMQQVARREKADLILLVRIGSL